VKPKALFVGFAVCFILLGAACKKLRRDFWRVSSRRSYHALGVRDLVGAGE